MTAPPPKGAWKASPDAKLQDLLVQMARLQVDFVEILRGDMTVSIVIGPTEKQAGLRDVVAEYKGRK